MEEGEASDALVNAAADSWTHQLRFLVQRFLEAEK